VTESAHDLAGRLGSGLRALVDRGAVPAASYAVVCDGAVAAGGLGGAGPHSVFQVGSVTKAFTGLLLADLVGRGQVLLSDPATSHLPGAVRGPATLLDIATHTAGLPRLPPGMLPYALLRPGDPYALYPERRFVRAARRSLAAAPGGAQPYEYSNYGYGLLGYLLGQAAGEPYEALLEQRVCAPLGLGSTSFDAVPVQGHARGRKAGPWNMGPLAAAGGLYSTAADLAVLLAACLDLDSTPLADTIRTALAPRRPLPQGGEIGLAWHHVVRDGHRVIWHNGMTGGFSAMVALCPERRAAVAALASEGGQPPSPLDAVVLDALFAA
jgi:D-alanyl-D-alanine-carboxypeptidase/D-alanyl-D-alanine-endopeptidase